MTAPKFEEGDWRKPVKAKRTDLLPGQDEFLEWLTDPESHLRGESQNKFAEKLGVHSSTLTRWRKDPLFVKAWEARLAEHNVNPERMQNLMDVLYGQGRNGNVKAIELYFRLNDRMTPERHVIEAKSAVDMNDEELSKVLEERARALRATTAIAAESSVR